MYSVHDSDLYAKQLTDLWQAGQLRADRAVVWSVQRANSGTVLVAQDAGSQVEVMADAATEGRL